MGEEYGSGELGYNNKKIISISLPAKGTGTPSLSSLVVVVIIIIIISIEYGRTARRYLLRAYNAAAINRGIQSVEKKKKKC